MEKRKFSPGLLLGIAALNSYDGVVSAIKSGVSYEFIRPVLSKDIRHLFETPIDDLIKELEP